MELTPRRNGEVLKGGEDETKSYLSGSVLVQNTLLELRPQAAGVSSQGGATGRSGEGAVAKGPGRVTSGDGTSAFVGRQSPPLDEALGHALMPPLGGDTENRRGTTRVKQAAAWRKWSVAMTGEALRRPTVGKPSV